MIGFMEGALLHGIFHGDLHGGNLLVDKRFCQFRRVNTQHGIGTFVIAHIGSSLIGSE